MAQAAGQERNLQVFIFTPHPALLDPLSARASSPPPKQGKKVKPACLGTQPSNSTCLTNKGWFAKNEKNKICKEVVSVAPLCFTAFVCFLSGAACFGEGVESRREGFKGDVRL